MSGNENLQHKTYRCEWVAEVFPVDQYDKRQHEPVFFESAFPTREKAQEELERVTTPHPNSSSRRVYPDAPHGYYLCGVRYREVEVSAPYPQPLEAEPVAWTTKAQLDGIKGTGNNAVMWGEPLPHHPDIPLYASPQPVTKPVSIVPPHCSGIALGFDPGTIHVKKDGSGYIAVNEDDFVLEDDRCEGEHGPEGSVHWIVRLDASEIIALRDFLNGNAVTKPEMGGGNQVGDGEASIIECLSTGKPFVFDPATNFLHADDGTVDGGIRYVPAMGGGEETKDMHRRAQRAEGAAAAVRTVLDGWEGTLKHYGPQLPTHDLILTTIKRELDKAIARATAGGEEPIVQLTTGMRELRASLIARTVRQSLRNYGHKTAESVLPECIAADVESALKADEKMWSARDCGVDGGSLTEARDCIGSAYTRAPLTTGGEEL